MISFIKIFQQMKAKRLTGNEDSAIDPDMARPKKDLPEHILGRYPAGSKERLLRMQKPGVSQNDLLVEALNLLFSTKLHSMHQEEGRRFRVSRQLVQSVQFRKLTD